MTRGSLRLGAAADPDRLYQILVEAHDGLTPEQGRALDTRLILLLANHIGEPAILAQAVAAARENIAPPKVSPQGLG